MSDQSHANTSTDRPLPEVNSNEEEEDRELNSRLPIYGELASGRSIRGLPPLWCTPCSPLHPIGGTHSRHNNNDGFPWESGSTSTVRSLESGSTSTVRSLESGSTSIVRSLESGSTSIAQCNPGAQSTVTTEEASPFHIPMHTASSFTSASDTVPSLVPTIPPTSLGLTIQDGVKEESFSSQDAVQASNNSMPEELVCPKVGVATPDDLVCPFTLFQRSTLPMNNMAAVTIHTCNHTTSRCHNTYM